MYGDKKIYSNCLYTEIASIVTDINSDVLYLGFTVYCIQEKNFNQVGIAAPEKLFDRKSHFRIQ